MNDATLLEAETLNQIGFKLWLDYDRMIANGICVDCFGTGTIEVHDGVFGNPSLTEDCPKCHGTGKIRDIESELL